MTSDVKHESSAEASSLKGLSDFLSRTKRDYVDAAKAGKGKEWTVVMGNEAGDLDSLASAIAYAWYASTIQNSPTAPLLQTPRGDLHLRAENEHAVSLTGLSVDDLLCIDDITRPPASSFPSTMFALVDHNRLSNAFSADNPDATVVAIIDHHADEGLYSNAEPRTVTAGIGSCSSLVALFLADKCADQLPRELATLLLSAIVIDTGGLVPGGKAVDVDQQAAAFLASRSTLSSTDSSGLTASADSTPVHTFPAIKELNNTLQEKKASVAHLGTRDLLRRDYKEYAHTPAFAPSREVLIGLASVPLGLSDFLRTSKDAAEFSDDVRGWMDERGLSALGVLTSFRDAEKMGKSGRGKHRREQMWVVRVHSEGGDELATQLFRGLEESEELRLKKQGWEDVGVAGGKRSGECGPLGEGWRVGIWKQKNADATRKATAPLVKAIVEGTEKGKAA